MTGRGRVTAVRHVQVNYTVTVAITVMLEELYSLSAMTVDCRSVA